MGQSAGSEPGAAPPTPAYFCTAGGQDSGLETSLADMGGRTTKKGLCLVLLGKGDSKGLPPAWAYPFQTKEIPRKRGFTGHQAEVAPVPADQYGYQRPFRYPRILACHDSRKSAALPEYRQGCGQRPDFYKLGPGAVSDICHLVCRPFPRSPQRWRGESLLGNHPDRQRQ